MGRLAEAKVLEQVLHSRGEVPCHAILIACADRVALHVEEVLSNACLSAPCVCETPKPMAARNTEEAAPAHLILNLATSFVSQLPRERGKECRIQVGGTADRERKILVGPRL